MLKKIFAGIAVLMAIAAIVLVVAIKASKTNEKPETTTPESLKDAYLLLDMHDPHVDPYANEAIKVFYELCCDQPEVLASTVSCFPHILDACGITTRDPLEIDRILSWDPNQGEYQRALLTELDAMLRSDKRGLGYMRWNCRALYLGMRKLDEEAPSTPQNIELYWRETEFEDRPMMILGYETDDDGWEIIFLDMKSGFARSEIVEQE